MNEKCKTKLDIDMARAAVLGGAFLGGGGGGSLEKGMKTAEEAIEIGDIYIVPSKFICDDDFIITASAVGSPASKESSVTADDCKRAYEIYEKNSKHKISGIITNENGGHSTTNGWILSASTGIPIVDAPCNGRAHPTGKMGSMGLSMDKSFKTLQVAVGGPRDKYLEISAYGSIESTSSMVRMASVEAGGLVTVLRNEVSGKFVRENAAAGGIKDAIEIGGAFLKFRGDADRIVDEISKIMEVEVLAEGIVSKCELVTKGGFDLGKISIKSVGTTVDVDFWNEYMTAEMDGKRIATFPDLIVTLDLNTGDVKSSAQIRQGDNVKLIKIDRKYLKLGKGMYDKALFKEVENVISKEMIKYNF